MKTVSVSRDIPGEAERIRSLITDIEPFIRSAGFDGVVVSGDRVTVVNNVGLLTIKLELRLIEDSTAALAYEQTDGIFEAMDTRYYLETGSGATTVTAETSFALDVSVVGPLLDATVIKIQREKELNAQLDFLESHA